MCTCSTLAAVAGRWKRALIGYGMAEISAAAIKFNWSLNIRAAYALNCLGRIWLSNLIITIDNNR